jgi:hypothetical protein
VYEQHYELFPQVAPGRFGNHLPDHRLDGMVASLLTMGGIAAERHGLPTDGCLHADDPDSETAYQLIGACEVLEQRRTAMEVAAVVAGENELSEAELGALMNACNVARMAFGRHLGIFDELPVEYDRSEREALARSYRLLSVVVEQAATSLSA